MTLAATTDRYAHSAAAFADASRLMPGGVSSPVRAYRAVHRDPVFVKLGRGCRVTDLDANTYIDYVMSYGPLILGHAPETVVSAVTKAVTYGMSFGMPTTLETQLAELVVEAVPSVERVRFVTSGTEAVMSALRLARAATGRHAIVKFTGCYHGHSDALLVSAGSGATTLGTPSSPGVTPAAVADTLAAPYNDLESVRRLLEAHAGKVAAVIVEPIAGNMGLVPPAAGFLAGLRELCDRHDALLIFDEVMTGFRVAYGGAQQLYGVTPDLTCLGKVIGGGMPCAAYGGPAALMKQVAPDGPVYQAGTLSGNPTAMAAGIATLSALKDGEAYDRLEALGRQLETGFRARCGSTPGIQLTRAGSMFGLFFNDRPVTDYAVATASRTDRFAAFFGAMLDAGIMLAPSQYETWFLSTAHDEAAIDQTLTAAEAAIAEAMKI